MSELSRLQFQIRKLKAKRTLSRLAMGWSAIVGSGCWLIIAVFLLDVVLEMTFVQRLLLVAIAAGAVIWVYRRYTRSWVNRREDAIDVALLIERHRGIDSDLVAALQFQAPAARYGSLDLKQAVIHQVADRTRRSNLAGGIGQPGLKRRVLLAAASVAVIAMIFIQFPVEATLFAQRLLTGSGVYPTDTNINKIEINGEAIHSFERTDKANYCPVGRKVEFHVVCSGELPSEGLVTLHHDDKNNTTSSVALKPVEGKRGHYIGTLPQMTGSLEFRVYVGDARTDWLKLIAVPPPVVQAVFYPEVPKYAVDAGVEAPKGGVSKLPIDAYEGSRVGLEVTSLNKPLDTVELIVKGKSYALKRVGSDQQRWKLDLDAEGDKRPPLAEVTEQIDFQLKILDEDGMKPPEGIMGTIRLVDDQPPRIEADIARRKQVFVLPTAKPVIHYKVSDDYAIADVQMHLEIYRGPATTAEKHSFTILNNTEPIFVGQRPLERYPEFDLSGYALTKGDQVKITLEAVDYRGKRPGRGTPSTEMTLNVRDQADVLSEITTDADARSEQKIRGIIERATGIEKPQPK